MPLALTFIILIALFSAGLYYAARWNEDREARALTCPHDGCLGCDACAAD